MSNNIIKDLKHNCDKDSLILLNDFLKHIELVLKSVDEFYGNVFFEIYEFVFLTESPKSQLDIGIELDVSQSNVYKIAKKINDYINMLLNTSKYSKLLYIEGLPYNK